MLQLTVATSRNGSPRQENLPTALWTLARPRMALLVALIPLFGYYFELWNRSLGLVAFGRLATVMLAWVLLHVGTMWLNSVLDGDEEAAVFARAAPVPRGLSLLAYTVLLLSVVTAGVGHWNAVVPAGVCALLAVLYSHPKTRWKGHPVLGPMVNAVGYGLLSPVAGWVVVEQDMVPRTSLTFALWTIWMTGAYFAAQVFQGADDARRGYRTLVVTHGPGTTLVVARCLMTLAIGITFLLFAVDFYPRTCLWAMPAFWWVHRHLRAWQRDPAGGNSSQATGMLLRMLAGGVVIFTLAYVEYFLDYCAQRPTAGLGTSWGRPH